MPKTPRVLSVLVACALCTLLALGLTASASGGRDAAGASSWPRGVAVVGYRSEPDLRAALARVPGRVVRALPSLHAVEVRPAGSIDRFADELARLPGIRFVERLHAREAATEPALLPSPFQFGAYEWQYFATRADAVPASVVEAARSITIAVVDSGADLSAPDLAAKSPGAYDVRSGTADVTDALGHGTFVASLAAGSAANGEGIAGFGGEAQLLVVRLTSPDGSFTDLDAANAIVQATDRGARVINLSFGGRQSSAVERSAVDYAAARGALLVAAVGNEYAEGNPVTYPAATLQPVGSNGQGGRGLSVAASTFRGGRAAFSNAGSHVSLAAPGELVLGALSSQAPSLIQFDQVPLPGSQSGSYGYGSGTSFAAPQVAGAAALVWAANPNLRANEVAQILKETAQGQGVWTPGLGYGVMDVAAAVARAGSTPASPPPTVWRAARSGAVLRLTTSRPRGRAPLNVRLTAVLAASLADVSAAERAITLEAFDGRSWKRVASGTTDVAGRAAWRARLSRGDHRLRARFAGAADMVAARSATLKISAN